MGLDAGHTVVPELGVEELEADGHEADARSLAVA
jgi:hypothetical protein